MRILILSDLHDELTVFDTAKAEADVVVLAVDIDNGNKCVTAFGVKNFNFNPSKIVAVKYG